MSLCLYVFLSKNWWPCLDAINEEKKPKAPEVYVKPKASHSYGSHAHWEKKKAKANP